MRQRIPRQFEVVGWRGVPGHRLSRARVPQGEDLRMQRRPGDQRRATPVDRIAQDRMMDVGEVDADLVRPPRSELDVEQGVAASDAEPRPSKPWTSVPVAWPGPGWTTSPAGLSMTMRSSSS